MDFVQLAQQFPTPFFVYDAATIRARAAELTAAFKGQNVKLYYAVKANDHPAIIRMAADSGIGACLVTIGEFERALVADVAAGDMLMNGVGKSRDEIRAVLHEGIGQLNIESLPELEMVAVIAGELGMRARIGLRINPEITAKTHSHNTVARRTDKFGLLVDDLPAARAIIAAHPSLDWRGFSCHIGSQIHGVAELIESYRFMADLFRAERKTQPQFDRLDFGGGFGVSYEGDSYARPAEYAAAVREVTKDLQQDGVIIQMEPGRFVIAEAGSLVTSVIRVKDSGGAPAAGGIRYLIVDAAMNNLIRPALYDAYHPITLARASTAHDVSCSIAGPVCESGDVFAKGRQMPADIAAGDVLVIGFAGAYGNTMSSMYNARDKLAEVMVEDGKARIIRRAMTAAEYDKLTVFN
ncbi:MAG: diaminopimelate decarboxylase [Bdellovibrionales bacterium]